MIRSLRIAVADDEPAMRDYYKKVLTVLGHEVVCAARNGRELVQQCRACRPDLVITDVKMPEMDGIEAAQAIGREEALPVIVVAADHECDLTRLSDAEHVLAYLVKPVKEPELEPAIALVVRRFEQFQHLRREAATLRRTLEERKVIERAKGILMRTKRLDEGAAFLKLQKMARDQNKKLVEMAQAIIQAEQTFQVMKHS
jgi:response regulator NasT